jgi:formate hydrogenlyase subunit 4
MEIINLIQLSVNSKEFYNYDNRCYLLKIFIQIILHTLPTKEQLYILFYYITNTFLQYLLSSQSSHSYLSSSRTFHFNTIDEMLVICKTFS